MKALVEATPISGPASVGSTVSLSRAIVEVGTLTTESVCSALRLGVAQRGQRIGGLAGLRNEDRKIALAQRRLAVAEFGGDIEFDRHAGEPLEPVFGDIAGIARGAAGRDRDALDILEVERQFDRQRHPLGRHVDIARQRVADHLRLLVDFLGHEVAIIRLVDQERRGAGFQHLAIHHRAVLVIDHADFAGQHHPVAVLEIADGVGEGRQRDRIRAQIHLAVAMADRQRRTLAGADHQIAVALEQERQRERAAQLRQRRLHRFLRRGTLEQVGIDQMRHDFGVGFAREFRALLFQHLPQLAKILDDAVVNHGDVVGRMRMRVALGRLAVGGPAGVSDAGVAGERLGAQSRLEILQLALGAAAIEMVAFERGDACGIVAAIFEALERIHQLLRDRTAPENADNAAHADQYPQIDERSSKTRVSLNENRGSPDTQ